MLESSTRNGVNACVKISDFSAQNTVECLQVNVEFENKSWKKAHISAELKVAETVEIEVGGGKEYFHHIGDHCKLFEELVLSADVKWLDDPADGHGDVGDEEHEGHHEQETYQAFILLWYLIVFLSLRLLAKFSDLL